jgi:hypothetical protein
MFEKHPSDDAILFAPMNLPEIVSFFFPEHSGSFIANPMDDLPGTAPVVIVDLGTGPFQVAVVIEVLESSQNGLSAPTQKFNDLGGTKKTVPINEFNDLPVSIREFNGILAVGPPEAGKA